MKYKEWVINLFASTGTKIDPENLVGGTLLIEPYMTNALLLMGIWRLDVSSRRLEKLTIGLCILTIPLVILSIIEILRVASLIP